MDTRKISFDILKKIESEDVFVGEVLDMALRHLQFNDKRDRAFITRLVEGTVERKISLDFLIDKFSKNAPDVNTRIILRMGIYQIKYMESVPNRAAIDESVKLVKTIGLSGREGYVNAVLRKVTALKDEKKLDSLLVSRMDVRYATPQWLCDLLIKEFGKDNAKLILEDQFAEHDTVIRINSLKTNKQELKKLFEDKGITVKNGILSDRCLRISGYDSIRRLPGYKEGLFVVQDETSVYTVEHAGIKPGDKILDICAAPGGKSMLAYELATDGNVAGIVVSHDISKKKLEIIKENAERLGIPCHSEQNESVGESHSERSEETYIYQPGITVEWGDATEANECYVNLPEEDKFDVVISDVPCSGLGIIGRKNDIKYHMTPEIMSELAKQGLVILSNASKYVKTGGRICYSTCTINPEENGEVVRAFLKEYAEYKILEERTFIQGIDGSDGFYFCILARE